MGAGWADEETAYDTGDLETATEESLRMWSMALSARRKTSRLHEIRCPTLVR